MNLKVQYILIVNIIGFYQIIGQESPCPEIYEYKYDNIKEEWYGWISIPNPGFGTISIATDIALLDESTSGASISFFKSDDETIKDLERGQNLQYRQTLPYVYSDRLPKLLYVQVNNKKICTGPIVRNYKLSLTSHHSLSYGDEQPVVSPTLTTPKTTYHQRSTPKPLRKHQCGKRYSSVIPTIYNGYQVSPHEYPWLVAIYEVIQKKSEKVLGFICTGSLISENLVLTAAHCTYEKSTVMLEFGRHNRSDRFEIFETQQVYSENFINHPDYQGNSVHADIGLIRIKPVSYSEKINPVCIAAFKSSSSIRGTIVGWGVSEDFGYPIPEPLQLEIIKIGLDECRKDKKLALSLFDDIFCGQALMDPEEAGPCRGDSGAGYYVNIHKKWHIRGIVSSSVGNSRSCEVIHAALFIDIDKYYNWIELFLN